MGKGSVVSAGMHQLLAYAVVVVTTLAVAAVPVEAGTRNNDVVVSPVVTTPALVDVPSEPLIPARPPIDLGAVAAMLPAASAAAADRGARISMLLLDRETGATVGAGADDPIATASVVKLFIADDILFRAAAGEFVLSPDDRATLDVMLRSSDDNAGESLWNRFGGSDIVARVAQRYGLLATSSIPGDAWWNTSTTMTDLTRFYSALAGGTGGLDAASSAIIIGDLETFTDQGADGYDQRFGIPDALQSATPVAVKQGWMCCVDGSWIHLSTGYLGVDHRYVLAVGSRELSLGWANATAGQARATVTQFLTTLFPSGSIAP